MKVQFMTIYHDLQSKFSGRSTSVGQLILEFNYQAVQCCLVWTSSCLVGILPFRVSITVVYCPGFWKGEKQRECKCRLFLSFYTFIKKVGDVASVLIWSRQGHPHVMYISINKNCNSASYNYLGHKSFSKLYTDWWHTKNVELAI